MNKYYQPGKYRQQLTVDINDQFKPMDSAEVSISKSTKTQKKTGINESINDGEDSDLDRDQDADAMMTAEAEIEIERRISSLLGKDAKSKASEKGVFKKVDLITMGNDDEDHF